MIIKKFRKFLVPISTLVGFVPMISLVACNTSIHFLSSSNNKSNNNKILLTTPTLSISDFFCDDSNPISEVSYLRISRLDPHLQVVYSSLSEDNIYLPSIKNLKDGDPVYIKFEVKDQYKDQYDIANPSNTFRIHFKSIENISEIEIKYGRVNDFWSPVWSQSFDYNHIEASNLGFNNNYAFFMDFTNLRHKIPLSKLALFIFQKYQAVYQNNFAELIFSVIVNGKTTLNKSLVSDYNSFKNLSDVESFLKLTYLHPDQTSELFFKDIIDFNK